MGRGRWGRLVGLGLLLLAFLAAGCAGGAAAPAKGIVFSDGERFWLADPEATTTAAPRVLLDSRGKGAITDPAWSPDRAQIAYSFTPSARPTAPTTSFGSDIYVISADGGNARAVFTHHVDGGLARSPVWAPDGGAIYFSYSFAQPANRQMVQQIERLDLKTSARTVVATNADLPALSPDGARLAFIRFSFDAPTPPALWIASASGGEARELVSGRQFRALWAPRFSPDGRFILFSANGQDDTPPRLTIGASRPSSQTWPPTVRAHGFPMDFWLVEVATGRLERLAQLGADDPYPVWAPDGKRLAFLTVEGLFLLDTTSGAVRVLANLPGFGALDWAA